MATIDPRVQTFMNTLTAMETSKDVGPMVQLFAIGAEVGSIALRWPRIGVDGARTFWNDYLSVFQAIRTTFRHVHTAGNLATLEWISDGKLPGGVSISYQGATIVEFESEKICRLRTYYDSAAFVPDGAKLLGREVEL